MESPLFRALAGFTDAKTGLPMGDISRIFVFTVEMDEFENEIGIKPANGHLFVDSCGIAQYFPTDEESLFVRFYGEETNESMVQTQATYQGK